MSTPTNRPTAAPDRPAVTVTPAIGGAVAASADDWGRWLVWLEVTDYATGRTSCVAMDAAEAHTIGAALAAAAGHVSRHATDHLTR